MKHLISVAIVAILTTNCVSKFKSQELQNSPVQNHPQNSTPGLTLEGVYRFESETVTLTDPEQATTRLTTSEWKGLWIFYGGHFSQTMMKIDRTEWTPSHFPNEPQKVGFDGSSGTYSIKGGTIELNYLLSFYPGKIARTETFKYQTEGDRFIFTEELHPGREYKASGERVIILSKLKTE